MTVYGTPKSGLVFGKNDTHGGVDEFLGGKNGSSEEDDKNKAQGL